MRIKKVFSLLAIILIASTLTGCLQAKKDSAEADMKQLGLLLMIYTEHNNESYPDMSTPETAKAALSSYLANAKSEMPNNSWDDNLFTHPGSNELFVPNPALSNLDFTQIETPEAVIAFYAPEPDGDERIVGYADGHVKWINESDWPNAKAAGYVQ